MAKQAATLDHLSGGRLVLGVAPGGRQDDYEVSGADFHRRGRDFDAMLDLWRRIWAGEDFGTAGAIGPPPPRGRPTLILGGTGDRAYERAAEYGDGWIMGGGTPDMLRDGKARDRGRLAGGGPGGRPAHDGARLLRAGRRRGEAADRYLRDYYAFLGDYAGMIAGSAATDAATVRQYAQGFTEAGCDELSSSRAAPDPDQVDLLADALA